ncbi:MAG TPA: hypothetical protein VEU31_11265 [Candidatus Acidoferrales bacterium]|nr:hypothetical protein [Candidatus Acidoferrales bacterium]
MKTKSKKISNRYKKHTSVFTAPGREHTSHESRIASHDSRDSTCHAERTDESLVQAVKDQFDAARHADLIEDLEKIIADDLLRQHGWPARGVALLCYAVTAGMMLAGWFLITTRSRPAYFAAFAALMALFIAAISLGAMRPEGKVPQAKDSPAPFRQDFPQDAD